MGIKVELRALAMGVVLLCAAVKAEAQTFIFMTNLSGPAESPPNTSPGTGQGTVVVNTDLNTIRFDMSFSNLVAPTTIAHMHCCTPLPFTGTASPATTVPSFP